MNGWFNPIHLHQHQLINILYCSDYWLCILYNYIIIYIYPVLSLLYLQSIPMYPHYNYPHVWLNQPYLLWPWIHSPKVSSLKPKLRRLSANLGVSVKSPFPRSGHQTWLGNPRTKWRFSLVRWELEKSSNYSWGISTVDDNKRVPFEHDASLGRMVVNHWSNGLNGILPGPKLWFLRILQIFPSTNSMNHSKWSQVVSSADVFFSDKCRSQRDFHRVDLVFTILNWLLKLLLKGIVSPLHHHYIHPPQDHHCIPDIQLLPIAINLPI
jgi:hypothetical protein